MDDASIVVAMCDERSGLRAELLEMEKAMHQVVFAFVTVAASVAGIYWGEVIQNERVRTVLVFGLTQVDFFFGLFLIALTANQNVHAAYIRALEEQINELCGRRANIWESEITVRFLFGRTSAFFWTVAAGVAFLFATFILFIVISFPTVNNFWGGAILIIELMILTALTIFSARETEAIALFARDKFRHRARRRGNDQSRQHND